MKNLIVDYNDQLKFRTILEDVPQLQVSHLQPNEILIKVHIAGCNPKDFKHPLPNYFNVHVNQGDDCAGVIAAVGSAVRGFSEGERVAGFHPMDTPHGTYAEYAICPATTVWRIPDSMSYEEAATMPLAILTAAVGLYRHLQLPAPWDRQDENIPSHSKMPLVINAASGAVGAFAIKLAKLNPKIGPIIATAGKSSEYVRSLGVDAVVDYRSPTATDEIRAAAGGKPIRHIFDGNNSARSAAFLCPALVPSEGRFVGTLPVKSNPQYDPEGKQWATIQAAGAWSEWMQVADVHDPNMPGGILFGSVMRGVIEEMLFEGKLRGHPYEYVRDGLVGVKAALEELRDRKKGGNAKFVVRITDTPGLKS